MKFKHAFIWVNDNDVTVNVTTQSDDGNLTVETKHKMALSEAQPVISLLDGLSRAS